MSDPVVVAMGDEKLQDLHGEEENVDEVKTASDVGNEEGLDEAVASPTTAPNRTSQAVSSQHRTLLIITR
jgi:hypothetical protein